MKAGRRTLIAEALLAAEPVQRDEWWRGAIFYEIYLRSFMDSDGDGVGDLPGVIDRLDHVADLNVDGLWLAPFYPSPQEDFGYDITDFCDVDPMFGTSDDLDRLIAAAHDRNLRILLDLVPCHTSSQHDWFKQSRSSRDNDKADWYIWANSRDDGGPPNNWLSSFGGPAWTWEPRRAQYFYHPFLTCQPALNLRNPETLDAMLQVLGFWLDRGVDGFRLDAIQCLTCDPLLRDNPPCPDASCNPSLGGGEHNPFRKQMHYFDRDVPETVPILETLRGAVEGRPGNPALIGELADVDSTRTAVKYTQAGERLHATYDFDLINAVKTVEGMRDLLRVREDFRGSGSVMNVFTNHDSERAVSNMTGFAVEAGLVPEAAKLLVFLQATLRGGGILFQGEELGLPQPELAPENMQDPWGKAFWPEFRGRDGVRTPIPWERGTHNAGFSAAEKPWLPVAEEHLPLAVDTQRADPQSVLSFVSGLLAWRRTMPILRHGHESVIHDTDDRIIAFDRYDAQDRLTLVTNMSLDEALFPVTRENQLLDVIGTRARREGETITLAPLGFCVIDRAG